MLTCQLGEACREIFGESVYQIERKAPGFSHGDISDWQV